MNLAILIISTVSYASISSTIVPADKCEYLAKQVRQAVNADRIRDSRAICVYYEPQKDIANP